jgi:hypothetical protein|tara:strand:- start:378 stop:530 length:153 start_codon:yes stop_codon:yes gene_type:complete
LLEFIAPLEASDRDSTEITATTAFYRKKDVRFPGFQESERPDAETAEDHQ